jgi:hypothetical protein
MHHLNIPLQIFLEYTLSVIDHPNGATHDRLIGPPYDRPNGASFKWPF